MCFVHIYRTWKYIERELPKVPLHIPVIVLVGGSLEMFIVSLVGDIDVVWRFSLVVQLESRNHLASFHQFVDYSLNMHSHK